MPFVASLSVLSVAQNAATAPHEKNASSAHVEPQAMKQFAGSRRVVLTGSGHLPQFETPSTFNAELLKFLHSIK